MAVPILKDNELCCPNCGIVYEQENQLPQNQTKIIGSTLNFSFLGSIPPKQNTSYHFHEDRDLRLKQNMLNFLEHTCKKYGLPEAIGITVGNHLLRKNRGHWSKDNRVALKALIKLLEKDDYYLFHKKKEMIKADYENLTC